MTSPGRGDIWIELPCSRITVIDPIDADLMDMRWHSIVRRGRAHVCSCAPGGKTIYLHRVIAERMGMAVVGREIDHRDTDGLNNRRGNLRSATRAENARNVGKRSDNKSGHKGVSWNRQHSKWQVHIGMHGKSHYVGLYSDLSAAAEAYRIAAERLHGVFARV